MEEKMEKKLGSRELAAYLEDLARGLKQGRLAVEGQTWTVPREVAAKVHLKEKKGRLVFKLSCAWETLAEYQPGAREPVVRWQETFQTLKKRLAAVFKEIQQAALQGQFPESRVLGAFSADSQALARMGEPEWEEALAAYLAHVEALGRAVQGRDLEAVRHEVADLKTAMAACHREFK